MEKILIKNGRVWDGERFFYADILTNGDRIAKIEPDITEAAEFVFDASGKTVSAGLVDGHIHMKGISTDKYGICTEAVCFPFGVTAAVDCGAELGDVATLSDIAVKNAVFVISEIIDNKARLDITAELIKKNGDRAVGVKGYFDSSSGDVRDTAPLKEICEFAHNKSLKVMVHCNGSPSPMAEILSCLEGGDVLTHAYHGGKNTARDDGFSSIIEAKGRGVIIDAGLAGHVHTDFSVFAEAVRLGATPDVISTDVTNRSAFVRGGKYSLNMCMSIAEDMGMSEEAVFRAVTVAPALAMGRAWGRLTVGGVADITVLDREGVGYSLTDAGGNHIENKGGYRCLLTLSAGQIVFKN